MTLLLFVTDQIAVDPTNLDMFLGALNNQPSAVAVAQRLERTYCKCDHLLQCVSISVHSSSLQWLGGTSYRLDVHVCIEEYVAALHAFNHVSLRKCIIRRHSLKFEVHTPFRFEDMDPGTKSA